MKAHKNNSNHGERIAVLETRYSNLGENILDIRIEMRDGFKRMDDNFKMINEKLDNGFRSLNNRLWQLFFSGIGACVGILYLIAHAHKWIGA